MAKVYDPNYDSQFPMYDELPDPPWYQKPLAELWQEYTSTPWEGRPRTADLDRPMVTAQDPARLGQGRTLESYQMEVPPGTPPPTAGPSTREDISKQLERSKEAGMEQGRFWMETLAGLLAAGLIPPAAVPSALALLKSGPVGAFVRNVGPGLLRKAGIAAAPAAVDVLTGAPEKAPETFVYSLMGEYLGGMPANVTSKVGPRMAAHMGTSPEGAITRRVLEDLNVPAPLAAQSKAAWTQRVEDTLRSSLGGGPLRRAQREGQEAITGKLTHGVREWPDEAARRPFAPTGTAQQRYEEMPTTPYGETTTLPEPPVTTGTPPPPGPSLPADVTGRLGLPRPTGGAGEIPVTTSTLTRQPHEVVQEALTDHRRTLAKAESMRYGQIDDVILQQRPDTGGTRVAPPHGEAFTMPVDVPTPQRPELPPTPQPPIVQERRPVWAEPGSSRPGQTYLREVPGQERVPPRDPLWKNVPEETPYDPAATEARYGTRRFQDVPARERPTPAPAAPSPYVDVRPAKDLARALQADPASLRVPGANDLLEQILAKPDRLNFADMATLRGDLLSVSRQVDDLIPGKASRYADKLVSAVDQEMAATARAFGPDTYKAWREANEFMKENIAVFEKPAVKRLLGADADQVFGTAATTGERYSIREAREAINNPLVWQQVQDAWMRKTVNTYSDPLTNQLSGAGLLQYLKQNYKEGALGQLFPGGHEKQLIDFATALAQIQRGAEASRGVQRVLHFTPTGGLAFPISAGAYEIFRTKDKDDTGIPGWMKTGAAVGTLYFLSPMILSRIMAKPELMRWAIEGMKVSPSTKRAHEVGGMLLGLLAKEGLLEEQAPVPQVNPSSKK